MGACRPPLAARLLSCGAVVCGAVCTPAVACAQGAPAGGGGVAVQELVVTGSRLPRPDLTADSPVVTVGAERLSRDATLTLETALNKLPQVTPGYSSASNNPAANGASYLNLRGLGFQRNLVLLDGRRTIGGNASNAVDLNTIPTALIDRVEILTGGASAVYGADAVAGVVNVILKRRFDGVEAQARTLVSDRGDGREHDLSLAAGRQFGDISLMGSIGWSRRDEIGKGARPFSSQADSVSSFLPSGSYNVGANPPSATAVNALFASYGVTPGSVSPRGGVAGFSFNADGTLFATGVPFNPAFDVQNYRGSRDDVVTSFFPDAYAYNFQPFNKLILPLERWTGSLFAEAQVSDRLQLFARVMGTRYTAATALAPTPAPTDPNPLYPGLGVIGFTIPVTNPFIPAGLAQLLASRRGDSPALAGSGPNEEFLYRFRAVALGPRQSDNTSTTGSALGGARLDLGGGWRGEAYASYGRYERREVQDGLLAVRRFEQLLDSPTGGRDLCDGGFNPFGGTLSQGCRDFLRVKARYSTTVGQTNVVASATGPLFQAPAGPVLAAVGIEYRSVSYAFRPPGGLSSGEIAGFIPLTAVKGGVRFAEVFGEATAPLLRDRPGAKALDLTVGYRRSQERDSGGVDSWKAELGWTPVTTLKVRGAVQRAVRAPDIFERFEPPVAGALAGVDPCSDGPARTPQILALCRRQGAALGFTSAFVDGYATGATDVLVVQGGNPDVKPEQATTFTLGTVWSPGWDSGWADGLAATVDGYRIRVTGAIGYEDPQVALNACYNLGGGNPTYDPANPFCARLPRSAADFSLFQVPARETNQLTLETAGVDFGLSFTTRLADLSGVRWLGRLDTRISATRLIRFRQQPSVAQPLIDYVGTIAGDGGVQESLPRWRSEGDVTWSGGPLAVTVSGRFIGPMQNRALLLDPTSGATGAGHAWYWDLSGRWDLTRTAQLRAGVLNLFDRPPELFRPSVDAGTDPSLYDVIGRRFWVGLRVRL